jgi:hypothetical protein
VKIIVCIKQVPDTETQIKIAPGGKAIVKDDIKWVMNPYDEYGVEEALRIKEKLGGEVIVVGLGPKRVTESLRTALAMGADKGILISDPAAEGSDALATAKALAAAIKGLQADLIFTGQRGVDEDMGIAGAALAEYLRDSSLLGNYESGNGCGRQVRQVPQAGGGTNPCLRSPPSCRYHHAERTERASLRVSSRHHEGQEETS